MANEFAKGILVYFKISRQQLTHLKLNKAKNYMNHRPYGLQVEFIRNFLVVQKSNDFKLRIFNFEPEYQ